MKYGNKDALFTDRDRYAAKNYITTWVFPLIPFFFSFINRVFKNMYNYWFINYDIQLE